MTVRAKIFLSLVVLAFLAAVGVMWMIRKAPPVDNIEHDLGFSLPIDTVVLVEEREVALNSEVIYLKIRMSRESWHAMFKKPPFAGMPKSTLPNPLLKNQHASTNWRPQQVPEGISGLVNVGENRTIQYCFDMRNVGTVEGYLVVGIQ